LDIMPHLLGGRGASSADLFQSLPGLVLIPYALVLTAIGSQVYRYFWHSNAVQRQQTKWVVLALAVTMIGLGWLGPAMQNPSPESQALGTTLVLELGRLAAVNLVFVAVPIAIAIAILRSKLWDVDIVIRRTLIYSLLTALLALAYFGSVLLQQAVFSGLTGNARTPLVTVLSTLAGAALFLPLRGRVQAFIDHRFYRRKYDAARTLAAFSATARDETDLGQLSARLVGVVDETVQPASVGLWLRKEGPA
jgi:hypothetical protein